VLAVCGAFIGSFTEGYIVSLNDADEAAFFADRVMALGLPRVLIGLLDQGGLDQEADYLWADLTPLTFPAVLGDPPWAPGEPDEPLAQAVYITDAGQWVDAPSDMSPHACEAKPLP